MKEGWRMNEKWERMKNEGWWFQALELRGFDDRQKDKPTDICE